MRTLEYLLRPCVMNILMIVLLIHLYRQGIVGFLWNFFMWIPTICASGMVLVVIGLVDLVVAIAILSAVLLQSTYLPHLRSDCRYAETWKNDNGTSNFFQVASNLSAFSGNTPQDVCSQYFTNWTFGLVIV